MGLQGGRITVTGYKFLDGIWHLGLEVLVDKNIKVNRNSSTKLSKIMDFSEAFEPTMSVDALHTSDMDGPWRYGPWLDGPWRDGPWLDGPWRYGPWHDGPWRYGPWHDGPWRDGPWHVMGVA